MGNLRIHTKFKSKKCEGRRQLRRSRRRWNDAITNYLKKLEYKGEELLLLNREMGGISSTDDGYAEWNEKL
jgi:hypothetical protein